MRLGPALAVTALCLLGATSACSDPIATELGRYVWEEDAEWFGGLSAINVDGEGDHATIIGDRGIRLSVRLMRKDGRIVDVELTGTWPLPDDTGAVLSGRGADAEGLALLPDGRACVSFEGRTRVACYASPGAVAQPLPRPDAFRRWPSNGALEALAADGEGNLFAIPERGTEQGAIPIYRWDGTRWTVPFTVKDGWRFRPVGLDVGPDGQLFLLERALTPLGFRARLSRLALADAPRLERDILLVTAPGQHGNLEGLSIWRDPDGRLRATMVADDNFNPLQVTEIVEYRLPE